MISQGSCNRKYLLLAFKALGSVLTPCNAWLFLLRVRVIPPQLLPHFAAVICTVLWTGTLTSFIIFPALGVHDVQNPDMTCSTEIRFDTRLLAVPSIALAVFDTAAMLAISIGVTAHIQTQPWNKRIRSMMILKHMGHISKVFLRSGQIYYM